MNILFYVEPLIELEKPYFKKGWLTGVCDTILTSLSNPAHNITLVLNEALSFGFENRANVEAITLFQRELLNQGAYNQLDLLISWYWASYGEEQLEYYKDLFSEKLSKLSSAPDVILTFSPVPFLMALFPETLILHIEYSLFSRKPFIETWYFDPIGMNGGAYLNKYWNSLQAQFQVEDIEYDKVKEFKAKVQNLLTIKSPFKEQLAPYKEKFDKLILLPLQFSRYYLFDGLTHYRSQFDYLLDVLEKVPAHTGVIVTTHPEFSILSKDMIEFLQKNYSNFIYDQTFEEYYASSQYLLAEVDAVVTVSSSVGLQTILWDKELITLGKDFLDFIAQGKNIERLDDLSKRTDTDKLLYWIMTHYAVPKSRIQDSEWFENFLSRSIHMYRQGESLGKFYYPIDDDKTGIVQEYIDTLDQSIPERTTALSYDTLLKISQNNTNTMPFLECYLDKGTGFTEEDCIRIKIQGNVMHFEIPIDNKGISAIRLDPVNSKGIATISKISIVTEDGLDELDILEANAEYIRDRTFYFLNNDPQLLLEWNYEDKYIQKLMLDIEYRAIGAIDPEVFLDIIKEFSQQLNDISQQYQHYQQQTQEEIDALNHQLSEHQEENGHHVQKINELMKQISDYQIKLYSSNEAYRKLREDTEIEGLRKDSEIQALQNELRLTTSRLEELFNSYSWKITKPIRFVKNKISPKNKS
ncbi:capsular polysaccharide export protein, LipB/KpsS family [Paenibacillus amylolyticus]|uniref:Uncharacterized protein n=1 Tax=Paenibacillus amylolyticus TaxID=1451 RepID=A0A100VRR8_PAEAM|nr:hypothetical protein [Paenibacillus amylolyticus]GAS84703.1 unknown protein [Paenibacillus amylolyticus]